MTEDTSERAPRWLQVLLDNQNQQAKQLQMMLAPVVTHITGSNSRSSQPSVISSASSGNGDETAQCSPPERVIPRSDLPPASSHPFAAELDVINQRSRNSGPIKMNLNPEPDSRRRDIRDSERGCHRLLPYPDEQRLNGCSFHNQHPLQEVFRQKLATFDGSDDWEIFIMPFERQARKYGWSAMERVDRLHECLRGVAIRYVCSLPERIREDYVLLLEQLAQRFGKKDPPTTVRRKLGELRQGRESSAEFAEEVQRLTTLAYPGIDLKLQDQLATDAFLKGLRNQKVAYEVMNRDPCSLAEAQKCVEAHEHNFKATVGRETEAKNRTRRISWADEEDGSEDITATSRRVQTPQYVTVDQFAILTNQVKTLVNTVGKLQLQISNLQSSVVDRQQPKAAEQPSVQLERKQGHQLMQPSRMRSQSPSPTRGPCFRCGEQGHFRRECIRSSSPTIRHHHSNKDSSHNTESEGQLHLDNRSQGLQIGCTKNKGESLQIPLSVNGIPTQAVIDTGAQTTIISEDLYKQFPKEKQINLPKTSLLNAGVGNSMDAMYGLNVTFKIASRIIDWKVHVAPIRDSVLLGLDLMKSCDIIIHARGKVFIGGELVPSKIVSEAISDYCVARVTLEKTTTLPPTSECVAWGEVDDPRPGVPALMESLAITEAVVSGSVVTTMEKRVPVRLCNFSTSKAVLPKGTCLGLLVETYPDALPGLPDPLELSMEPSSEEASKSEQLLVVGRVAVISDLPEHLHGLVAAASETLDDQQQQRFIQLLSTYQALFAKDDTDLGYMSAVTHKIDIGSAKPVRQPVRRTPLGFQSEEKAHLQSMLQAGVITPSLSEWASPVVLVRKKDGGVRWCVDYRRLNNLTIKDAYPLPKIEECLDVLGGATMFSTLDLQSGYWQIAVDDKDREKTAFVTRWGLYEYTRMPFGLCNAPSTFQRAMELVLRGFQWETLLIYLDDIIVLGRGVDESLDRLTQAFERLHSYGLKLKPAKCHLLKDEVLFLGHIVSGAGIQPNPSLIRDVQLWSPPTNIPELKAFLGLCSYYRKFVPAFAELASPLHELLKKETTFLWADEHQNAFTMLKEKLVTAPVLGYPIEDGKYILDTDASNHSIGAVLSQLQWGEERVISYASNHLTPVQQRYCVTRRELLAVVRYSRQFRHYLLGRKFLLRTDHNSLTWLFRFKHPEGQLARWLEELSQYDFDIEHRAGHQHSNADSLSRQDIAHSNICDCYQAGKNLMDLPCHGCKYCQRLHEQWTRFEDDVDDVVPLAVRYLHSTGETSNTEKHTSEVGQPATSTLRTPAVNWMETLNAEELAKLQRADPVLSVLHAWKESGDFPSKDQVTLESPAVRKFWLCWPQVVLRQGVLYYSWERVGRIQTSLLLLVPVAMQTEILQACHNPPQSGHLGEAKTLERLRQSYYWYRMGDDVHLFIKRCPHCNARKASGPLKKAKLQNYQAGAPLDRLHLDILGPFPVSSSGNKYILIIIDQFTRWVEAFPIPDQGAETTAKKLVYEFIARFGAPLELHTDQGRNFESSLFKNVCKLLEITKTRTTPYHPASNGQVERFNRTLLQMIRCYVDTNQRNWDEHLPLLASAYRSSQHAVTGFSPNMLMLGREVHQPQGVWTGASELNSDRMEIPDFLYSLEKKLKEAHNTAREHLRTSQERQKKTYDVRAWERSYSVGDLVYVKDDTKKKGLSPKLQAPWKGPLLVSACRGPVLYEIQGPKNSKIIHHDRLKPYDSEVVPAWVRRQRSKVLQQCQGSSAQLSEEDLLMIPEFSLGQEKEGKLKAAASRDDGGLETAHKLAATGQHLHERKETTDGLEKTVKTLSGRTVRKPQRFNVQ